ncbi:MAG: branched-chain amino acid ABC transporter permease [Pseudomonadota bacterium]
MTLYVALLAIGLVFGAVVPLAFDSGFVSFVYLILYFVCLTSAWNLFSGFSGYINFGFVAFIGIGMYASVIAIVDLKLWWPIAWAFGGFASACFAAIISYPILRTRGAYFSIAMLAIAEGVRILSATPYLAPVTRGGRGISLVSADLNRQYYAMLVLAVALLVLTYKVARSRFGLELLALREDEGLATGLGINNTRVKIIAFVMSAFFAGAAGGVHAAFIHYVEPTAAFDLKYTIFPVIMAQFGGLGTVAGPIVGGVLLQIVSDLAWLHLAKLNLTIFGLILIGLLMGLPQGLVPALKDARWLPKTRGI